MKQRIRRPPGPKGYPLVGCGPLMARDPLGFMCDAARYGDLVCASFGPRYAYLVNHPDLIEALLVGQHRDCIKDPTTRQLVPLLGQGLLTSEGELWRKQRKLAAPPLQPKRIEAYADTMVECAERKLAQYREDEVRDVHADMMQVTLEIVGKTLLGFDTRRDAQRVSDALEDLIAYFDSRLNTLAVLLPAWLPTPLARRFKLATAELDKLVYRMIERARSADSEADHLLARLLRAQSEQGERMSDAQARDEAVTMLLAGHETTALALSYALYALSQRPECLTRLREELAVLGGARARVSDLTRLPYLDAVIRETLRLYPPAWAIGRTVVTPFNLGGYELPANTEVLCSPFALHRDPRFYPEPERFMPERWIDPNWPSVPRYAFLPFGAGPRVCIGNHFAKMEAALVLATFVQDVTLRVVPGYQLELQPVITMRPRNGMPVLVQRVRAPAHAPSAFNASLAPPLAAQD